MRVTSVWVAEVGVDHVSLGWRSAGGSSTTLYQVSYWTTDADSRNISLAYSTYTNITLRALRQQSVYSFRVCQHFLLLTRLLLLRVVARMFSLSECLCMVLCVRVSSSSSRQ